MSRVLAIAHRENGISRTPTVAPADTRMAMPNLAIVAIDLDPRGNLGGSLGHEQTADGTGQIAVFHERRQMRVDSLVHTAGLDEIGCESRGKGTR